MAVRWLVFVGVATVAIAVFLTRPAANPKDENTDSAEVSAPTNLPALKDFGSDKCIPCKTMAPILVELKTEYAGKFTVDFFDIWKDNTQGAKYGIQIIPTQIFFAADGTEMFRHEGFYSKDDILNKWRELGVEI